jgi:hypothetical protein
VQEGGYGVLGLRQINTCRKVPLQVNFLDNDIWHAFYQYNLSAGGKEEVEKIAGEPPSNGEERGGNMQDVK